MPGSTFNGEYMDLQNPTDVPGLSGMASNQPVLPSGAFAALMPPPDQGPYMRPPSYVPPSMPVQSRADLQAVPDVTPVPTPSTPSSPINKAVLLCPKPDWLTCRTCEFLPSRLWTLHITVRANTLNDLCRAVLCSDTKTAVIALPRSHLRHM